MYKLTALLLISLFLSYFALAQKTNITGKITDSVEKKDLSNGSVLLLRNTDSIMVSFTRTDKNGNFNLKNIPSGHFLILVSYPSYADYVDHLDIKDSSAPINLPPIGMVLKSALLQQVIVSGNRGAIQIKGDTLEFKADSFRTQAGASVEDLLKKLPGIQVDKNGKITAQGVTVQKVLVDGEEFFGDDPTLVTQNLRADMVDKVQVFDKKSDQAAFTGIDDGVKNKTINLKLKDNKKNGYFGKLSAGAGTDSYYDVQAMINMFKKKQKLAAFGIMSNTGKTGLNWQDRDNYGQSFAGNIDYDETTNSYNFNGANNDLDSWDGRYNGQGLPSVKTGGIHYNNKWADDKFTVNGNYKAMMLHVNDSSTTNSQYILPDTLYYNNQKQRSTNEIMRHSFDGSYEIKFDSTSSLKIMADGGTDHKTTNTFYYSEAIASDSSLVNQNTRNVSTIGDTRTLNSNLLWRKKLPKKGRTVSINFRENYSLSNSNGYLNSDTRFYSGGSVTQDSLTDQYKNYHTENTLLDSKISYSEPLSKVSFLVANYGISYNKSNSDRNSYNKSNNGKYSQLDSLYSNNYQFDIFSHRGGLAYSLIKKKFRLNAGSNVGFTSFEQQDLVADTSIKRHFVNWFPQANAAYSFSNQRRISINYNGNTVQPTLQQLQPIRTNEDPLNIILGNPGLKPQFRNRFGLNFYDYKVFTERSIWASISYSFTENAISNSVNVDPSSGKRITQSVNVDGNYSINANIDYDFKWKKPELNFGLNGNVSQNNNASIVNNSLNNTRSGDYKIGARIAKFKEKKYDVSISGSADYTVSQSSINTGIKTNYWTYEINPDANLFLPLKFQIHADCDVLLRQKTSVFDNNNNVTILNAWIGKKFLKNDALLIKAAGNDLLNQNIGFSRTVNSNFISQNRYATIRRYFMLSVVWNFTKAGTPAPAER